VLQQSARARGFARKRRVLGCFFASTEVYNDVVTIPRQRYDGAAPDSRSRAGHQRYGFLVIGIHGVTS
jgi:hypothetical protein